jgi:hypothetical protein
MSASRRSGAFALIVGALAALILPAAVLAAYPPGPFPGPAPVGAFPVVIVSTTVCGAGQVTAADGTATVTVDVPIDAFADCTQVTVYGVSGDALGQLLPTGQTLIRAYAVGWDGSAAATLTSAAATLTLTIEDPSIDTGSFAYRTSGSGLVADATAVVEAGRASTDVSGPAGFVLATTDDGGVLGATGVPAPETSTAPLPPNEPTGTTLIAIFVILGIVVAGGVIFAGRRRARPSD